MYRLLPTTAPSPSRHYYPWLIAGTNLPTPKGWIAWLAKSDCTHITLSKVITQLNPKAPEGNEPRWLGPRPTQYQWTNGAVHYRPRIQSQKTAQSAVGVNPKPSEQLRPMTIKTSASTESATTASIYIYIYIIHYARTVSMVDIVPALATWRSTQAIFVGKFSPTIHYSGNFRADFQGRIWRSPSSHHHRLCHGEVDIICSFIYNMLSFITSSALRHCKNLNEN